MTKLSKIVHIGPKILIDFPGQEIFAVPAKVDTGADNSSIWASDIKEKEGVLSFVLFGEKSKLYTGNVIQTDKYTKRRIKNSFGDAEDRYCVVLSVKIGKKKFRTEFTLADRSRNSFPILVGRRSLKGRFVVDVSKEPPFSLARKMLIVSGKITPKVSKFSKAVEAEANNLEVRHTDYTDFIIRFLNGQMTVVLKSTGEDLAHYDIVHFKTSETRDITASLARYCINNGVKILDPIVQYFPTTSKLYQYTILSNNGIMIPDSVFVSERVIKDNFEVMKDGVGLPFVLKGIHSSKGTDNYLIKNKDDFDAVFSDTAQSEPVYLIAQKFIPNNSDYRVLIFGQVIELIIERTRAADEEYLNNTSKGGSAVLRGMDYLPEKVKYDSLRAAALLGRDVAGVDMMQGSEDGVWYCLEVNDGPQIASGAFVDEKVSSFAKFMNRRLGVE